MNYLAVPECFSVSEQSCFLSFFIRLLLPQKSAKSREILQKLEFIAVKVIQGHRSCCQSKAHIRLPISH